MDTLRSTLTAVEHTVRKSTPPTGPSADNPHRARIWRGIAGVAIAALVITNIGTWRALERERARHLVVERSYDQPPRLDAVSVSPGAQVQLQAIRSAAEGPATPTLASPVSPPERAPARISASVASLNGARLAKKLADPAARDAFKEQLKGPTLQLYGDLLKRWNLSGAAAEPVLEALADHQSRQLVDALAPGSSAGNQTADRNAADNDAVRAALNAKELDELRTYDDSLVDRQTIGPLVSELELAQTPLSKDTVEQLVTMMHDERLAVPQPTPAPGAQAATAQAMTQWQTDLDQRILDRAEFILPSAAVAKLQAFQNAQRAASAVFASATTPDPAADGAPPAGAAQP